MNASNVLTQIETAVNASIAAGDLVSPLNIPQTCRDMIATLSAREVEAIQMAKDLAQANAVALAVKNGKPVVQS
jgi:hypothetical protein